LKSDPQITRAELTGMVKRQVITKRKFAFLKICPSLKLLPNKATKKEIKTTNNLGYFHVPSCSWRIAIAFLGEGDCPDEG
jgi:hypothetical protein